MNTATHKHQSTVPVDSVIACRPDGSRIAA
jgi:hypothetical protein